MPYDSDHLTQLSHLRELAARTKSKLDEISAFELNLRMQIQILEARYDANVTALTDTNADYAAEVADGRADAWGNVRGSLGTNIREGQLRIEGEMAEGHGGLQAQVQQLSEARLKMLVEDTGAHDRRKKELAHETAVRSEADRLLQWQIQELSEAILKTGVMLSEIRKVLREINKEE